MRTKIIITYNWNDGANGTVAKNHLETLDNIAEMNIREQMAKGYTSGDLTANIFNEDFTGDWYRNTAQIADNEKTIQQQIEEREEYFSLNYKKKEEALENEYKEKTETALKNHEKEYQKKLSDLEAQYQEKLSLIEEKERNLVKSKGKLEDEYRTKLSEIEERKEIIENARQEKIDAVEVWQYGADLNLGNSCAIARYPDGYSSDIPENAYRIMLGLYQGEVLELIANSETMKQLMNNSRKIQPITEAEFKEKFINL